MNSKFPFSKTLGPISANLVNQLLYQGKVIFTLNDVLSIYGNTRQDAIKLLSDLVKRGVLARIKAGVYCIMQTGQENAQLSNWPIITKYLVENDDYYISYYSAMRLHGMTTHALREAIVTTPKRRRAKKVSNFSYNFIYTKAEYIWGVEMHWVSQQDNVCISDLERTLLDGLARPELCGGIKEIVRGIWVKQEQINWDKVLQYAAKFHTKAAVKRLGFIFELLHLGESYVPQLAQITSSAKDYILLDPGSPKTGRYLERWHIRLNVNIEELKESIWG